MGKLVYSPNPTTTKPGVPGYLCKIWGIGLKSNTGHYFGQGKPFMLRKGNKKFRVHCQESKMHFHKLLSRPHNTLNETQTLSTLWARQWNGDPGKSKSSCFFTVNNSNWLFLPIPVCTWTSLTNMHQKGAWGQISNCSFITNQKLLRKSSIKGVCQNKSLKD